LVKYLKIFLKERKSDRSFFKSKRAIALLVALFKRAKKERSLICYFAKSAEKSDRSFALFKRANERAIAQSLF